MSSTILYAELLLNIRQVTAFATLSSDSDFDTSVSLSPDLRSISITHRGNKLGVELPCQVVNTALRLPLARGLRELSFRLQVGGDVNLFPQAGQAIRGDEDAPWPASSLTPDSRIACRSCSTLLAKETISIWKDLPSENWAEMMDFWHCHKPNDEGDTSAQDHVLQKGYAASNQLIPSKGVGLVDISHILLVDSDCTGTQESSDIQSTIECSMCATPVGIRSDGVIRLFKWSIRLRREKDSSWECHPLQKFISAQLLSLIGSQATHKFLAYDGAIQDAKEALLLWVFNPDLMYSSSLYREGGPRRAMKIFYKTVAEPAKLLERNNLVVDELPLPEHVLRTLRTDLKASSDILPQTARKLQQWDVGLLER